MYFRVPRQDAHKLRSAAKRHGRQLTKELLLLIRFGLNHKDGPG